MTQGVFSKEEAVEVKKFVNNLFDAIPKSKRYNYVGELNDILLFISAASRSAPSESDVIAEQLVRREE